jgi:hypothetical protein
LIRKIKGINVVMPVVFPKFGPVQRVKAGAGPLLGEMATRPEHNVARP